MSRAPLPDDEPKRRAALQRLEILDSPSEPTFNDLTQMATEICAAPIGVISLIDGDRVWFKSAIGVDVVQIKRDISFCAHAILTDTLFEVPDATADPRFADNPVVTGGPCLRFYAGVPLVMQDGVRVGMLCVLDHVPRKLSDIQRRALSGLARQVVRQLEARLQSRQLEAAVLQQAAASLVTDVGWPSFPGMPELLYMPAMPQPSHLLKTLFDALPVGVCARHLHAGIPGAAVQVVWCNHAATGLLGIDPVALEGAGISMPGEVVAVQRAHDDALRATRAPILAPSFPVRDAEGHLRTLRMRSLPLLDAYGEVAYVLDIAEDISAQHDAELDARRASRIDRLTGLPNRIQFVDLLEGALARARRLDRGVAVVFVDIDHFRQINTSVGPATGDRLLLELSQRMKQAVRATDTVARLAGDEFVVILEGLHSPNEAQLVAQKLLSTLAQPWLVDQAQLSLQFSAGIAYDATHAHTASALIGYADELLYIAKSAGGNTFRITAC